MKRTITLATVLIALVALTASPAGAHGKAATSSIFCNSWDTAGAGTFDSLQTLAPTSYARGDDTVREPSSSEVADEVPAAAKGKGGPSFRATVDVWFHVVSDGAIGNVSDKAIQDQMQVLNLGYGGFEGGFNTGFRFRLVGATRTDNAAWFNAGPGTTAEREMKKALHKGDASTFNVYATTAGPYLGWAYFPSTYKTKPWIDGLVIDWESMPGTSTRYAGRYDLGKTATHEAGHWFGLYHVFQGGCNNFGDYVDDTPPQLIATRGCPVGQDSCKEPGIDSIHNYMDYSYDSCYDQFTADQSTRMQDQWLYFRADGGTTVQG